MENFLENDAHLIWLYKRIIGSCKTSKNPTPHAAFDLVLRLFLDFKPDYEKLQHSLDALNLIQNEILEGKTLSEGKRVQHPQGEGMVPKESDMPTMRSFYSATEKG